ncbi:MAG: Crp/Fnr family transcriptional regulator [Spirochaetaceae bacterium]|nr:Crp/Fnr family transcriptional regulator [Spirochaetaceae bacterium]
MTINKSPCQYCSHNLCAAKVPIFHGLDDDELRKIIALTGHRTYGKGETLVNEGMTSETLYLINEGRIKLFKTNAQGKVQILHILGDGDFFGELNVFSEGRDTNYGAVAVTRVKVCSLSREQMTQVMREHPGIAVKLVGALSQRVAETENLAQNLSSGDAESRTAFVILELAEDHGKETKEGLQIDLPLSREELAAYAGLTRETLTRRLMVFEQQGLLRFPGTKQILLLDAAGLVDRL